VEHLNPQLKESVDSLANTTLGFIKSCANTLEPMKTKVLNTICDIRENQVKVDQKALEMYDITLKLASFVCMTNRMGKNQQLKSVDRLRMFFSSDGQKNKHVRSVIYLQEFMRCREPLIKFLGEVEDFKKRFSVIQERKRQREAEKKKRELMKKERLAMIERGLKK
jgi:hypothetical protein